MHPSTLPPSHRVNVNCLLFAICNPGQQDKTLIMPLKQLPQRPLENCGFQTRAGTPIAAWVTRRKQC